MLVDKPLDFKDIVSFDGDRAKKMIETFNTLLEQNKKGSITVCVNGDWGSGKSTYLNSIQSYYKDYLEVPTLFFEAWKYKDEENILFPLIEEIKSIKGLSTATKTKLTKLIKPILASSLLTAEVFLQSKLKIGTDDIKKL